MLDAGRDVLTVKDYYAIFRKTEEAIEVEFPDLKGCVTYNDNWDEAITNATDALAAWLGNAETKFIKEPSTHEKLKNLKGKLVPIPVDDKILQSHQVGREYITLDYIYSTNYRHQTCMAT